MTGIKSHSSLACEQTPLTRALLEEGVEILTDLGLRSWDGSQARLECVFSGKEKTLAAKYLVPITARLPDEALWQALAAKKDHFQAGSGISLNRIGDCRMPGIIAAAVYDGHKIARELGQPVDISLVKRTRFSRLPPY